MVRKEDQIYNLLQVPECSERVGGRTSNNLLLINKNIKNLETALVLRKQFKKVVKDLSAVTKDFFNQDKLKTIQTKPSPPQLNIAGIKKTITKQELV